MPAWITWIWTKFTNIWEGINLLLAGITMSIKNSFNGLWAGRDNNVTYNNFINEQPPHDPIKQSKTTPRKKKLRSNQPFDAIPRFLKDNETEKNAVCEKCGVKVHLSFSAPIKISGPYEIKHTRCLSCQTLILELRTFTTELNRRILGRLDIKEKYGPWQKISLPELVERSRD